MMTAIRKFMQSRIDDAYYTPDTPRILQRPWHPLFVYGTLKSGFCREEVLEDSPKVGSGFTRGENFRMYHIPSRATLLGYPVLLPSNDKENMGRVYGEVYLVSPKTLRNLDFIESNGIQYRRSLRVIDINDRETPKQMSCWMYVGEPASWKKAIQAGGLEPLARWHQQAKDFKYYLYTKADAASA